MLTPPLSWLGVCDIRHTKEHGIGLIIAASFIERCGLFAQETGGEVSLLHSWLENSFYPANFLPNCSQVTKEFWILPWAFDLLWNCKSFGEKLFEALLHHFTLNKFSGNRFRCRPERSQLKGNKEKVRGVCSPELARNRVPLRGRQESWLWSKQNRWSGDLFKYIW